MDLQMQSNAPTGLSKDEARESLRAKGLRCTAPRLAVLMALASRERPQSHTELVGVLRDEDLDQATIYRNLVKLTEAELVRVASNIGGVRRYELVGAEPEPHLHPHFSCTSCGQVTCLAAVAVLREVEAAWQAALDRAELQFVGVCPACT